jgi:hypothetical protein
VSEPEPQQPVVTRLPEALEAEAEAINAAADEQRRLETERALAETDEQRLRRESGDG